MSAHSDYIVYDFSGRFEQGLFGGPVVPLGSDFQGKFSFDEFGLGEDEPFNGGLRSFYEPVYVELTVGNDTISTNSAMLTIQNAITLFDDDLELVAGSEIGAPFVGALDGHEIRFMQILLSGRIDTFATSEFPRSLTIEEFQGGNIHVIAGPVGEDTLLSMSVRSEFAGRSEFTVSDGRICSTPTCQIPEPHALALAACGFAAMIAARSFRRVRLPQSC